VFLLAIAVSGYGFERDVSLFHAIECGGIANVMHFGRDYRVVANVPDNLEQYLDIAVKNDTLFIETKPGQYGLVEFLIVDAII
jgi:hypothetical protein